MANHRMGLSRTKVDTNTASRILQSLHLKVCLIYVIITIISLASIGANSQFISHFNQKGLRGNITFDVKEADSTVATNVTQQLVIEAILEESDQSRWLQGHRDEVEFDGSRPILFDWSLHTNTLESHMMSSCSSEDLGQPVGQELQKSLTSQRPIALGKPNRWTLDLNQLLQTTSAKSLSSLIWGKSIKIKLSNIYGDQRSSQPSGGSSSQAPDDKSQSSSSSQQPPKSQLTAKNTKPSSTRTSSAIARPQLAFLSTPSPQHGPNAHGKPTFAPRAKPSITKPKIASAASSTSLSSSQLPPAPALPKPEALVAMESSETVVEQPISPPPALTMSASSLSITSSISSTSSTTSTTTTPSPAPSTTAKSREVILEATNRRIVKLYGNLVVCGNIIETREVKTAEAVFESQIGGKITIRGNEDDTTLLMLNLYHIRSKVTTRHDWTIMASDILDQRREDEKCKYLQVVFDPNNLENDAKCGRNETGKCRMGDLTKKHGQIQVAGQGRRTRTTLVDLNLPLSALEGSRALFLVIYEVATKLSNNGLPSRPTILSCAPIKSVSQRRVEAAFNMDGVRGYMRVTQRHPSEPAVISYDLFGLENNIKLVTIRELPLATRTSPDNSRLCSTLGAVFDPRRVMSFTSSSNAGPTGADYRPTIDLIPVGNLSAKHGPLSVIDSEYEDHYMGEFTDHNLQLYGTHSISGRSILIHKNNGEPWVCATLQHLDRPVHIAVASFYYPVVGQIVFQQPSNDPHAETSVLVEVYNPNGVDKPSDQLALANHNWLIHLKPAMADFYNWSQRCESTGEVFDPILSSVGLSNEVYARQCSASLMVHEPLRCRTGDTSLKSGFKLALPINPKDRSRYFYTDLYLPLSGQNSILGRSVVIYDDMAPVQRGNRLACSNIKLAHPLRASVKSWDSGPSIPSAVRGSAVFEQVSANRQTQIKLDLSGLSGNVEHYAIHDVWTTDDHEFPCSNDSLYDIYDPQDSENSLKLPPTAHYGASATVDRVKVGDMSRKHGTLEGLQSIQKTYTDANLPLFAPHSIIGRSMVLRASVNDFRWVCGNVELDYDKSESRELIGLASFDDPRAKISGYVRFSQLEHKDGSLSDTFIQVDLRGQLLVSDPLVQAGGQSSGSLASPSAIEQKTSEGHNWAVFVNQVGEDAYISADEVRCIAAGFKWNPYLAQDTLDAYPTATCTPSERLGCAMGDLGLRHGLLTLGPNHRRTLSDSNLPLVGNYSVMGRSLVIFDNKRPNVKLACANIFPDIHLKSNVVIKRTPSFTVARFVEQMRSLLGASDWLLVPELRATKPVANGECVQMTLHFYGQRAHQMQVELNNLITLGTVRKSSRFGVEKISTHYRLCRAGQAQLTSGASGGGGLFSVIAGLDATGLLAVCLVTIALWARACSLGL